MNQPKNINIDIGLDVLCIISKHGETLPGKDIAEICDCTANYIYEVEKRALRKLKLKLMLNVKYKKEDLIGM